MMMSYSPDQEILSDLYNEFAYRKAEGDQALHTLGMRYAQIAKQYKIKDETLDVIRKLCDFSGMEEQDAIEAALLRADILRRQGIEQEVAAYEKFCSCFEGDTRNALKRIPQQLLGKTLPYRIRNKKLHMDIFNTPAIRLGLDFDNVLVEDGHKPQSIMMTRIMAEKTDEGWYRFSFIGQTEEDRYPAKVQSFLFQDVNGRLDLYNYAADPGTSIGAKDKLPWRRLLQKMNAMTGKLKTLGMYYLNDTEMQYLPVVSFFQTLIRFYLEPDTGAGNRFDAIVFSQRKAAELGLEDADIDAVCAFLPEKGCRVLIGRLERMQEDMMDFCRFWIHYASTSQSATLYKELSNLMGRCAGEYPERPAQKSYGMWHEKIIGQCDLFFSEKGWCGSFPNYYTEISPEFVEVSSIYSKMYTYVNEKRKSRSVQILESVSRQGCTVTALGCDFLLKDKQSPAAMQAMDGYFTDGGRRNINYIDSILLDASCNEEAAAAQLEKLLKEASSSKH